MAGKTPDITPFTYKGKGKVLYGAYTEPRKKVRVQLPAKKRNSPTDLRTGQVKERAQYLKRHKKPKK